MNRKSRVWDWTASRAPMKKPAVPRICLKASRFIAFLAQRRLGITATLSLALATPPPGTSVPLIIGSTVAGDGALSSISPWPDFEPHARYSRAFRTTRLRACRRLFLWVAARLPETPIALCCLPRSSADHALAVALLRGLRCGLRAFLPSDLTILITPVSPARYRNSPFPHTALLPLNSSPRQPSFTASSKGPTPA